MILTGKISFTLRISVVAIAILLISPSVFAQTKGEKEPDRNRQCEEKGKDETRWMTKNLYLSSAQYDKVMDLNLYYSCLMDGLNHSADKATASKKKGEIIKNKEAEFKAVLSKEQFEQYKSRKEKKVVEKKSPFSGSI